MKIKLTPLQQLAQYLSQKADIYTPTGRIYAFEADFTVRDGRLFHGDIEIDPTTLTDGHGQRIQF